METGSARSTRDEAARARLAAFAAAHGLEDHPRTLDCDLIEAFCRRGLVGLASSTKGTYRSRLRRLAATSGLARGPVGAPFPGARAPAPYSALERAELFAIAAAQKHPAKVASAAVLVVAGLGAGLCQGELIALSAGDVELRRGVVVVRVRQGRPRLVPVRDPHGQRLLELAQAAGEGFLFRPGRADRSYKNFVNDFCRHLLADPGATKLSLGRFRASFLCDHLQSRTPLDTLLAISGIVEVGSLLRYARHVPSAPQSKAGLRLVLVQERGS